CVLLRGTGRDGFGGPERKKEGNTRKSQHDQGQAHGGVPFNSGRNGCTSFFHANKEKQRERRGLDRGAGALSDVRPEEHGRKYNAAMKAALAPLLALVPAVIRAEERTERFDKAPGWDGHNNRAAAPRTVTQDFGYSKTNHPGSGPGEVGGFLSSAAEPSFYARKIPERTFDDALTASRTLACHPPPCHALVGFFNAGTLNEWRTPNTIALR